MKGVLNPLGNLEQLSNRPISSLKKNIIFLEYQLYVCGTIPLLALTLSENQNFSRLPLG